MLTVPIGPAEQHTPLMRKVQSEPVWCNDGHTLPRGINNLYKAHTIIDDQLSPVSVLYCRIVGLAAMALVVMQQRNTALLTSVGPKKDMKAGMVREGTGNVGRDTDQRNNLT